jgi:hypothetical protein
MVEEFDLLVAPAVCVLVATWTLSAQDAPVGKHAALDPEPAGMRTPSDTPQTSTEPGVALLTTFPGDSGPSWKEKPDTYGAVGAGEKVDCRIVWPVSVQSLRNWEAVGGHFLWRSSVSP